MCLNEQNEDPGRQGASESVCTTHSHELTALALSARGTMVATASTKVMDLSIIFSPSSMDHIKLHLGHLVVIGGGLVIMSFCKTMTKM